MPKLLHRNCLVCGEEFTTFPSLDQKFCSRPCFYSTRRKSDEDYTSPYRMIELPEDHPLCPPGRRTHLHRVVLWDKIGPGPHPCHHCGELVNWEPGRTGGGLVADHLDRNKLNNNPDNLVPSCFRCNNLNKDSTIRDDEPHKVRKNRAGRHRCEIRNCADCGKEYPRLPSKDPKRHRFCSASCATRNRYRVARELRAPK